MWCWVRKSDRYKASHINDYPLPICDQTGAMPGVMRCFMIETQ